MRRLLLLALLVPLASGCGWFGGALQQPCGGRVVGAHVYPSAPLSHAPRWVKLEHLPQQAIRGAGLFQARDLP